MAEDAVSTILAHTLSLCKAGLVLVRDGTAGCSRAVSTTLLVAIFLDIFRRWRAVCEVAILAFVAIAIKVQEFAGNLASDVVARRGGLAR